jgi:hypothetical protein
MDSLTEFFVTQAVNQSVTVLLSFVKNPDSVRKFKAALIKLAAVLTVAIQALGEQDAADLDAAIDKAKAA